MKTGIIIQETIAGLSTVYHSVILNSDIRNIESLIDDERLIDVQFANRENYFVVEYKKGYKFYRFVSPKITDFTGRAGYYSINLVVELASPQQHVSIDDPHGILMNIESIYNRNRVSDSSNFQEIENCISNVKISATSYNYLDSAHNKVLFEKIDIEKNISDKLNSIITRAVKKVCFYSENAVEEHQFTQNKYEKFTPNIDAFIKEIKVTNSFNIPFELRLNNEKSYNLNNISRFFVNSETNLSFKVGDEKTFQDVIGKHIEIRTKRVAPPIQITDPRKPLGNKGNLTLIISSLVFILGIGGYFAYSYFIANNSQDSMNENQGISADNQKEVPSEPVKPEYFEMLNDSTLKLKAKFINEDILGGKDTSSIKIIFYRKTENVKLFKNEYSQNIESEYNKTHLDKLVNELVNKSDFETELEEKMKELVVYKEVEKVNEISKETTEKKVKTKAKEKVKPDTKQQQSVQKDGRE